MRIVAIGDSITKGVRPATNAMAEVKPDEIYTGRIEDRLKQLGGKVINAGVGGNTSTQGLARFDDDVINHQPHIVLILFGANDQVYEAGKDGPRVTVEQFKANLSEMVRRTRAAGGRPILVTSPPLGTHWHAPAHPIYEGGKANNAVMPQYARGVRDVGEALKVTTVDLYEHWSSLPIERIDAMMPDGVHPNAEGHAAIAEAILAAVWMEAAATQPGE